MVGYIGVMDVAVNVVQIVDYCLGKFLQGISKVGGIVIIIVDYGNVEYMWDEDGNFWIVYIINLVLFILIEGEVSKIFGYGIKVLL